MKVLLAIVAICLVSVSLAQVGGVIDVCSGITPTAAQIACNPAAVNIQNPCATVTTSCCCKAAVAAVNVGSVQALQAQYATCCNKTSACTLACANPGAGTPTCVASPNSGLTQVGSCQLVTASVDPTPVPVPTPTTGVIIAPSPVPTVCSNTGGATLTLPEGSLTCAADADCVGICDSCCSCSCGDNLVPINKNFQQSAQSCITNYCGSRRFLCPAIACFASPTYVFGCVNKICVKKSSTGVVPVPTPIATDIITVPPPAPTPVPVPPPTCVYDKCSDCIADNKCVYCAASKGTSVTPLDGTNAITLPPIRACLPFSLTAGCAAATADAGNVCPITVLPPIKPAPQIDPVQTYIGGCLPPSIPPPTIDLCTTDNGITACKLTIGTPPTNTDGAKICDCLLAGIKPQLGGTTNNLKCRLGTGTTTKKRQTGSYVAVIQATGSAGTVSAVLAIVVSLVAALV
jgi:hypothetical protein